MSAVPATGREPRDVLVVSVRACASLLGLLAILVGLPVAMARLTAAMPIAPDLLTPATLLRFEDGTVLLLALVLTAWAAWSVLAFSLIVEFAAVVRRTQAVRLPGLGATQRLAGAMLSGLSMAIAVSLPNSVIAAPDLGLAMRTVSDGLRPASADDPAPAAGAGDSDYSGVRRRLDPVSDERTPRELRSVTVVRHDTLWGLAERHLGSGERFSEIVRLNLGKSQPDGRALSEDGRIFPGWKLLLPMSGQDGGTHLVRPGESMWQIAHDELGDGSRYREIFSANRARLQPDGQALVDPRLIRPGWQLTIPETSNRAGADDRILPDASILDRGDSGTSEHVPPALRRDAGEPLDEVPRSLDRGPVEESPAPTQQAPTQPAPPTLTPTSPSPVSPTPAPSRAASAAPGDSFPALDRAGFDAAVLAIAPPEFVLPAGGVLALATLVGLARQLRQRRQDVQRYRKPGERLAPLTTEAAQVERAAASASAAGSMLLEHSLRQLAHSAQRSGTDLPALQLLRFTAQTVRLELASPQAPALAPFRITGDCRWELDAALLSADGAEHPRAYPALVTIGVHGEETIMVDLVSLGVLRVVGDPEDVSDVRRAVEADLAFGPASQYSERILDLSHDTFTPSLAAGSALSARTGLARAAIRQRVSPAVGQRAVGLPPGGAVGLPASAPPPSARVVDPPLVVLSDRISEARVAGGQGVGVILTTPSTESGVGSDQEPSEQPANDSAILEVKGALATLHPSGLVVRAPRLPDADAEAIVDLFQGTEVPEDPEPQVPPLAVAAVGRPTSRSAVGAVTRPAGNDPRGTGPGSDAGRGADGSRGPDDRQDADESPGEPPRLRLLGDLRIDDAAGRAESSRMSRLAETAAFIHLNPGARPSQLQGALWPGRLSNAQTCRQMISRTRTWLGRDADGSPYLLALSESEGRLRLRDTVTSDWQDLRRLASAGLADPADTELLTQALSLVRGRPFGPLAGRGIGWAEIHVDRMLSLITDVAHELARRHLAADRPDLARAAALRGLLTECESLALEQIARGA